jgi:predicted transcriptional regulator
VTRAERTRLLEMADAGHTPLQIASALGTSKAAVWAVLRRERPARPRAARTPTSAVPAQVKALQAEGFGVGRIASLLGISRAYVYRILQQNGER